MDDNWFKLFIAAIGSFLSYGVWGIQRNNKRHDKHEIQIHTHDKDLAVIKEQVKSILEKIEDVLTMGTDLKKSNRTILSALARKSKRKDD